MLDLRLPQGGERPVAVLALAALAIGILWSLQAATEAEPYDVVRTVDPWDERGSFTYAPILADGSGERAMGEPGYFMTEAPHVRVGFSWTLDDPTAERVTALGELALVARGDGWTETFPLAEATYDGAADGALALEGLADLPAAEAALGVKARDARWAFVATVRFASAPGSDHRADASAFELPLSYAPPLYTLPGPDGATSTKDHADQVVEHHPAPSPASALAARPTGPALVALGVAGLALYLRARPSEEDAA